MKEIIDNNFVIVYNIFVKKMKFIENEYCELKSILTEDIKNEIIVFSNTNGDKNFIGINYDEKIIGQIYNLVLFNDKKMKYGIINMRDNYE